jgi:hypothetical protein
MRQPGPDQEGTTKLRFHQPANVVLLCCNCHTLFDDPAVTEVDQQLMFFLRDRALAAPNFAESVRTFICQEMAGSTRRETVGDASLAPLFDWLKTAIGRGALSPPHRFMMPWGNAFLLIDLATSDMEYEDQADPSLPRWDGTGFT